MQRFEISTTNLDDAFVEFVANHYKCLDENVADKEEKEEEKARRDTKARDGRSRRSLLRKFDARSLLDLACDMFNLCPTRRLSDWNLKVTAKCLQYL